MIQSITDTVEIKPGVHMPWFGLGVYLSEPGDEVKNAVRWALDAGYRLIDTATLYKNEEDVGIAVKESGIPREELFITTKIWMTDFDHPQQALEESLRKLQTDYVDLYLLHWPGTDETRRHHAWEGILQQAEKGKIRACGVSNFEADQLELLIKQTGAVPANNQIELHPWHQRREVREYCAEKGISITSWGPLLHRHLSDEPVFTELAEKYGKTPAQVVLRWHLQSGINIIPKSVKQNRIIENAQFFDFEIEPGDMERIDALDGKGHFAFDPYTFNG